MNKITTDQFKPTKRKIKYEGNVLKGFSTVHNHHQSGTHVVILAATKRKLAKALKTLIPGNTHVSERFQSVSIIASSKVKADR